MTAIAKRKSLFFKMAICLKHCSDNEDGDLGVDIQEYADRNFVELKGVVDTRQG